MPIRAAVELTEGAPDDAFEAAAVNLSRGGMSLRSPCLPDIGARLWCSFEHAPSGSLIRAEGEVVWAQIEGDASGEIGLAFTDLDPHTEHLIEQIIADHGAPTANGEAAEALHASRQEPAPRAERAEPEAPQWRAQAARVTNLSLEGIAEPLATSVAEVSGDHAVFEQVLPLLQLGRAVHADAPELMGRRGAIAAVELRMMGHVPTLAVTVAFEGEAERFGEFRFTANEQAAPMPRRAAHASSASELDAPVHDTEPDLQAPLPELPAQAAPPPVVRGAAGATLKRPAPRQLALDAVQREAPEEEALPAALISQPQAGALSEPELEPEPRPAPSPRASRQDESRLMQLDDAESDLPDFEAELAAPAWKPALVTLLRALRVLAARVLALTTRVLGRAGSAALPHLRLLWVRARAASRLLARSAGPRLGAARRLVAAQLGRKRRRTTAGAGEEREPEPRGALGRMIAIGALVTAAAALFVYALIPSSDVEIESHRPIAAPEDQANSDPGAAGAPAFAPSDAPAQELGATQAAAEPAALPMPSAASVPAGSPFAVDVRGARAPSPTPVAAAPAARQTAIAPAAAAVPSERPLPRNMRFGASAAPVRAQRFALRMSKPIQALEGVADSGGFTVTVRGTLSLDRAGPISASHRGVARAMVLNKGDHAELTIRFADGKRPAYQLRAEGSTLHLVIEDV